MSENEDTTVERVELDPETADEIADKTATKLAEDTASLKAQVAELKELLTKPQRTELDEGGVKAQPGESVFYGGDDRFTYTGDDDAERATNLYLTKVLLEGASNGKRTLSPRGAEVMVKAAEKALRTPYAIKPEGKALDGHAIVKTQYGLNRADAIKAMTSTGANAGDDWVPTFASAELWRDIHLATSVAAQIQRVNMPTNPYDLPTETADPTFYYASTENVAVTASNVTTNKATLTAKKIQAEVNFSGELTEDSIIPVVPAIRFSLVRRAAQTIDDLIVHGDTETGSSGNVNKDDGAPAAGSFYLALDGMRKFCLVTNTGQVKQFAAAPTTTLYLNTRSLLGKYGARSSDLIIVTGFSTQNSFADVAGFKVLSDYGPQAAILQGEVGKIYNTPVFLSEAIPGTTTDKVDDDGKWTNASQSTNDTDGWLVLANRFEWVTGFRRDVQVESFRDIQKDQNILVCSFRQALIPSGHATTHTAVGYDITVL
jgi:HK97 family phage major capsid protein